ncbi:MAG TPA: LysE family transporter [Alphaproteobacteria bacterium]|nr:LysE family transporter [Alphaproteobacteria bacterium]
MIDPAPLLKIIPIFAAALIVPGPDFMMISSMALSRGRFAGVLAAVGIAAGVLVYVSLCMFGFTLIFARMHWLLAAIRIGGGLYLIYLGTQLWRASMRPAAINEEIPARFGKKRNPFVAGFLTNMTNPKALAFFSSIFALILPPAANIATRATILAVMAIMPVIWFGIVSFGLSTPAMQKLYLRASRWIDRVVGTFLALFGLRLLLSGKN